MHNAIFFFWAGNFWNAEEKNTKQNKINSMWMILHVVFIEEANL